MAALMHERQARLLADARSAEPRARLSQAFARADFLLRLSQTVSAVQHPARSMEAVVSLLVEELVSFAQVTVVTGVRQVTSGGVDGHDVRTLESLRSEVALPAVDAVLRRGLTDQLLLASGTRKKQDLAELVPDERLAEDLHELDSETVLMLPLSARGRTYGALALARRSGYGFDPAVIPFLEDVAQRLSSVLDAALVVAENRHVAQVLRRSLLPADLPAPGHLDLASYHRVAHEHEDVGGDFFGVHGPEDDLTVIMGDVAGRGIEAAVLSKRLRIAVRTLSHVDRNPGFVLGMVNQVMLAEAAPDSEALATAVCARLRPEGDNLHVQIADAGHPDAVVIRADGEVTPVRGTGLALGVLPGATYETVDLLLAPGDLLLLYTDGVVEATGSDEMFGEERLLAVLEDLAGTPARAVVDRVAVSVSEHLGDREHDDIAVLAIRFPGLP